MIRVVVLCCVFAVVLSADILAVFPHTGKSHFDVFEPLVRSLVSRGHRVTVISFYPQKNPAKNYTDVSLVGAAPIFVNALKFEHLIGMNYFEDFMTINNMGVQSCRDILTHKPVQDLLKSSKTFDLLMIEMFNTDCFLGLVNRFKAPYLAISSSSILPHHFPKFGNFDNPAYFPNLFLPFSYRMSFAERVANTVVNVAMRVARGVYYSESERKAAREAFGGGVSLEDISRNASLFLINSHLSYQGPRPLPPACVEVGGLHIRPSKPLPQDLERYLNESEEGVLLFSMGSVLQSSSFPADKRQAVMDAFAELPVRVLMKWEDDTMPGKPPNVKLSKWLPQRDVLAHPKIVAFMGHGGMLSTSEALYCGVPMVLIPMFGDQPNNVAHLREAGAAVRLLYHELSKETILQALRAVLYNPRYRERAQALSAQFKDRPMSPLDTAVYWTEYVLRHKGAPHLRSPAVDMPWYQLWLVDVVLALFTTLVVLLLIVYWLVKTFTMLVSRLLFSKKSKDKRE